MDNRREVKNAMHAKRANLMSSLFGIQKFVEGESRLCLKID